MSDSYINFKIDSEIKTEFKIKTLKQGKTITETLNEYIKEYIKED